MTRYASGEEPMVGDVFRCSKGERTLVMLVHSMQGLLLGAAKDGGGADGAGWLADACTLIRRAETHAPCLAQYAGIQCDRELCHDGPHGFNDRNAPDGRWEWADRIKYDCDWPGSGNVPSEALRAVEQFTRWLAKAGNWACATEHCEVVTDEKADPVKRVTCKCGRTSTLCDEQGRCPDCQQEWLTDADLEQARKELQRPDVREAIDIANGLHATALESFTRWLAKPTLADDIRLFDARVAVAIAERCAGLDVSAVTDLVNGEAGRGMLVKLRVGAYRRETVIPLEWGLVDIGNVIQHEVWNVFEELGRKALSK